MNVCKFLVIVLAGTWFSTNPGVCQSGHDFDKLTAQYIKTRVSQDSVQQLIDSQRQLLDNDPSGRERYAAKIINLEDQLYNLNTRISTISRQINEINPDAYLNLVANYRANTPQAAQNRTLVNNIFFRDNLDPKDIKLINDAATVEVQVEKIRREISNVYRELSAVREEYLVSKNMDQIDSLLERSAILKKQITATDAKIHTIWDKTFDRKIESYLVIADKLGVDRAELEQIEEQSRQVRAVESRVEKQLAPQSAIFDPQRKLALRYEIMLANRLQLTLAKDSLQKRVQALPEAIQEYPDIEFPSRSLVVYSKVTTDGNYDFHGVDIPEVIVPRKGVYYSVQVITLQNKVKQIETFRKIAPLRTRKLANGWNQYLAGGFAQYKDAVAAQNQVARLGFKNTAVVPWVDGKIVTIAVAKTYQETAAKIDNEKYQVEIATQNAALIARLREIVDEFADNKQISRTQRDNQVLFIVTQFDKKSDAEQFAEIVRQNDRTDVTVVKIEQEK